MALTDTTIWSAKSKTKPWDTLGLFLLVQPSGRKLWHLKYRLDGRKKLALRRPEPHRKIGVDAPLVRGM